MTSPITVTQLYKMKDAGEKIVALLKEQVGGFYNPKKKLLILLRHKGNDLLDNPFVQRIQIVHELTHALQDMYINLDFITDIERVKNEDLINARAATVEGQASIVMVQYVMGIDPEKIPSFLDFDRMIQSEGTMEYNSAPLFLKEHLFLFPYIHGSEFYKKYLKKFPDTDPISIFDRMPLSSEHVYHFSKYLEKDFPQRITLDSFRNLMGSKWRFYDTQTFGELDWRLLFKTAGYSKTAERDAEGWDGATFYIYENITDSSLAMCLISTWDTEGDRDEAAENCKIMLKKKYPGWKIVAGDFVFGIQNNNRGSFLLKKDNDMIILDAVDVSDLMNLKKKVFSFEKKEIKWK